MFITKKSMPRRTFLKGASGVLALPLLEAMIPASVGSVGIAASGCGRATIMGPLVFGTGAGRSSRSRLRSDRGAVSAE